jgi:structural maintenance of chromosome 3 (chondroitin sulfate proteoglycan 6)
MDINNLNGAKRELRQIERIVRKSQVKADRKGRGKDKTDLEATDEESVDELEEEKRKEQKRFRCKIPEPTEKSRLSYAIEGLFEKNEQLAHDSEEYQSMVDELKKLLEESKGQMDRQAQENKDLRERIRKGKRLPEEDEPNDLTNSFSESKIDEIMNQFEGHPLDAIRGLKTLLDDVKRELRKLKEENCELQGSLHELRKNYPSICQELVEENDRYEQEIKALKEQMANVEKLTADLELAGEQRVELEREYATLMQNLEDKKNEEIRKLTEQLAEERAKSEDLDRKLFEMRNKLENLEALEIEREKMRNKLIKENDRYERQLKEREEYIEGEI